MPTASDWLRVRYHATPLTTDERVETTCPTCGLYQKLSEATLTEGPDRLTYTCPNGCPDAVLSLAYLQDPDGGSFSLHNPSEVIMWVGPEGPKIVIEAAIEISG